jgi:hypothetical protein
MIHSIKVDVPHTAVEVAALQRTAESDAKAIANVRIGDVFSYADVDGLLGEFARRSDGLVAMRKRATGPMYKSIKEVESWFRPALEALAACVAHCKGELAAERVRQASALAEANAAAVVAAETDDAEGLVASLQTSLAAQERPDGARSTVVIRWAVKRIVADLLPAEFLIPDAARIDGIARAHRGDEPPIIPGVVFERVADVKAKR